MLFKLYQTILAAIKQWFETIQFASRPAPVRIRIDQSEYTQRLDARQQRALHEKYRR